MDETNLKPNKRSGRAKDVMFRVAYQHQGHLVQLADYKASMIINICTMIISAIIAVIGYGVVTGKGHSYVPVLVIPILLIVLACLISLVFSMQAARPQFIFSKAEVQNKKKSSLLFFGVIASFEQEAYLKQMKNLMQQDDDVYEQMTIDLYNQGVILKRKYLYLKYAYSVLLIGFVSSVVAFFILYLASFN